MDFEDTTDTALSALEKYTQLPFTDLARLSSIPQCF